jgi:hypothetical protein
MVNGGKSKRANDYRLEGSTFVGLSITKVVRHKVCKGTRKERRLKASENLIGCEAFEDGRARR